MDDLRHHVRNTKFKRLSYPLCLDLQDRKWGSDSNIHRPRLPPIAGDKKSSFAGKEMNRPPTPCPSRSQHFATLFHNVPTARNSNSLPSSNKKLSMTLDLSPLLEKNQSLESLSRKSPLSPYSDHDSVFCNPPYPDSPKLTVRSLPCSPVIARRHPRRSVPCSIARTRSSEDSERIGEASNARSLPGNFTDTADNSKEDMILKWIQDVEEKGQSDLNTNSRCDSTAEYETCQALPVIDENLQSS